MGYKMVCLNCRKSFSAGRDYHITEKCQECGSAFVFYDHKFRPPRKNDLKAWKLVGFLYEHGFTYQHVYKDLSIYHWSKPENHADYPESLEEAKEFVIKFESQSKKLNR
jgi:hypothetical protein